MIAKKKVISGAKDFLSQSFLNTNFAISLVAGDGDL